MTDVKGAVHGHSGEQGEDEVHYDAPASPKYSKKDAKRYVAFQSDGNDSSEVEEETTRKERKKLKKDRSNTFREKFKSIKVKKKEKETKEKSKEKEKEEKKEKKEKKKHKRSSSAGATLAHLQVDPPPPVSPVFGVPLELAVARSKLSDGIELPRIFRECIQYLEEKGTNQEGIYRVSGVKSKIDELKSMYDHGQQVDLESEDLDPNIVAGLLKLYLRELPVNVLTPKLLPVFDALVGLKNEAEQVNKMKQLLSDLPTPNYTLISWLFVHLDHVMKKGSETKMGIQNISIVFSPTMHISHGVLFIIMTHIDAFFPDVQIVRCVEPVSQKTEQNIPHSPRSLEEELNKQEVFLDTLHHRMNRDGADEDEVMEQMWEVQRTVTQLKRRLKTIRRTQRSIDAADEKVTQSEAADDNSIKTPSNQDMVGIENDQRDRLQLEIDKGKTKLQGMIKEDLMRRKSSSDEKKNDNEDSATDDSAPAQGRKKEAKPKVNEMKNKIEKPGDTEKKKAEQLRKQKRNEEHSKILERSKEIRQIKERKNVEEKQKQKIQRVEAKEDQKSEENIVQKEIEVIEDEKSVKDVHDDEDSSDDDEVKELLRQELRLQLEQEELLALSAKLKDRIQTEWSDVDRLQLEIDEIRKSEDYSSPMTSSNDDSSTDDSDSGTDSDEDNSELENILKELEKENEKLENQTMDLLKALADERERCVQLRVDMRLAGECTI